MNSSAVVRFDTLAIVKRQNCPRTLAQDRAGDAVRIDVEAIAVREHFADHRVHAAEQRLML